MEITAYDHNLVTECHCCGQILWTPRKCGITSIHDVYLNHLSVNSECKEYHGGLPSLTEMKGIFSENA